MSDIATPSMGAPYRRVATAWHTVSIDGVTYWTDCGYESDAWPDIECPEECRFPNVDECLFSRISALLGLYDDDPCGAAPRRARAHINGPDANGRYELFIEWGNVVDPALREPGAGA